MERIADALAAARREVAITVPEVPADAWSHESDYPGWTYKDHLSHLPESHRGVHTILRAAIEGRKPDFSRFDRLDEINEKNRVAHVATPIDELLAAFLAESAETQRLVRTLSTDDESLNLGPFTLGQALQGFVMHDTEHLGAIRGALSS
jgi:uncharacterized damage-inducible protein DinB